MGFLLWLTYLFVLVQSVAIPEAWLRYLDEDPVVVLNELQRVALITLQNDTPAPSQGCSLKHAAKRRDWYVSKQNPIERMMCSLSIDVGDIRFNAV